MELHPEFPVVNGTYQMTQEWVITLQEPHNRRVEDGSLVLWRPGFTIWVNVWGNDNNKPVKERASWLREEISKEAFKIEENSSNNIVKIDYRIDEKRDEGVVYSLNGFVINNNGHVQVSMYFDTQNDLALAKSIFNSINELKP